eukprot:6197769-Pleurochrysis_carterae.AAC.2
MSYAPGRGSRDTNEGCMREQVNHSAYELCLRVTAEEAKGEQSGAEDRAGRGSSAARTADR